MPRYRITLAYDGTDFHGWQKQTAPDGRPLRTVQQVVQRAVWRVMHEEVEVTGASRTDAGVHALGQVAHLDAPVRMPVRKLQEGLNDLLPAGIHVLRIEETPPDFHARHHARARSYVYLISRRRTAFGKRYVWWVRDRLDVKAMQSAARDIAGFHDFASFADRRLEKGHSTRVQVERAELFERGELIVFRIAGSHFLWKMVRRLVGTLVEIGRGSLPPRELKTLLDRVSEAPAAWTAPPSGLYLEQVLYEGDVWSPEPFAPLPLWGPIGARDRS